MKKSELRELVREHMRTRFMFEKDEDHQPEQEDGPDKVDPMPEPVGSPSPHDEAIGMGLIDKKWGRYADPNTGKIVAKTIGGKLVKVEPEDAEEDRTAPEPTKSGFNYDDPYGDDYPKPKGQLGAVPPVVNTQGMDDDPYGASSTPILGNKSGRPNKISQKELSGEKGVARRDTLSKDERDAYSKGGAGTFKGSEPTDGALTRLSPDGQSMSWSKDGPLETPDIDISAERNQAKRVAANMLKKHGSVEKALATAKRNREIIEKKFKQLSSHNTNTTPERLEKLKELQRIIDRLTWAEEAILKASKGNVQENVLTESSAGDQAKKLGLISKGWGRYADPSTGAIVAKSVNGQLVKIADMGDESQVPEDDGSEVDIDPEVSKGLDQDFGAAGMEKKKHTGSPTKTPMHSRVIPGWNKGKGKEVEVEFDAHADETVAKLLAKVGDPMKLMKWLVKKYISATPKGKKRIAQYIGILKKMGKQPSSFSLSGDDDPRDYEI